MHYNVIIIGAGSGGYKSAEILADAGKSVLLIESEPNVGGVCLNWGCIPTKSYIAVCENIESIKTSSKMGIDLQYTMNMDFSKIKSRKDRIVKLLSMGLKKTLAGKGIEILNARAELKDGKISADGKEFTFDNLIVGTGSMDKGLPSIQFDHEFVLDSKDILSINYIPENLVIVGAGVIGVEMATVFSIAGSNVTLVEYLNSVLPQMGNTAVQCEALKILNKSGVKCITGTALQSADKANKEVTLSDGSVIKADAVLLATGRKPVIDQWVKDAGIEMDERGFVKTDSRNRTSVNNIFAVGDMIGEPMLAHKAYYDAKVAAHEILGKGFDKDYSGIPSAVFTIPPISVCGVSEDEVKKHGVYKKYEAQYAVNGRAATYDARTGFCSIITDKDGIITGATIIGKDSDVMIHELALLIQNRMNINAVHNTVHIHPTLSEIIEEALQ